MPRFLQLHSLTSYPAALLNRDDVGFAKRIPFGGVTRTRISSQCLKRHWRAYEGKHSLRALGVDMSIRSRETFEALVVEPLIRTDGVSEELARAVTRELMARVLGERDDKKSEGDASKGAGDEKKKGKAKGKGAAETADSPSPSEEAPSPGGALKTNQVTVLGHPEINYLRQEALAICRATTDVKKASEEAKKHINKERAENLKQLRHASGLDAALFGRMVTSDILARGDAAAHVAHAFTVHAEETETDYFSVVDELLHERSELGSGHIGTSELTSGLFYGYVVVDVPLLVSNLEACNQTDWKKADRTLTSQVIESLVHVMATATPGAKLGSTAPYSAAHLLLAEAGDEQPRTLANAFMDPVRSQPRGLLNGTYDSLAEYLRELDRTYEAPSGRALAALRPTPALLGALGEPRSLADVAKWCAEQVRG